MCKIKWLITLNLIHSVTNSHCDRLNQENHKKWQIINNCVEEFFIESPNTEHMKPLQAWCDSHEGLNITPHPGLSARCILA
jgi:hypothetical protein